MAGTRRFDFISLGVQRRTWAVPTITISPRLHLLAAQIVPELCKPVSLEETRAQGKPGARCTGSLARKQEALRPLTRPTLPRPPHPVPNVRDDRDTSLVARAGCTEGNR